MNAPERFNLHMTRFIRAPRDKVYDALTTQAGMASWMGSRGTTARGVVADSRVGGAWRVEMHARDGSQFVAGGEFKTLDRPARVAYTWRWEGGNSPMPNVETLVEISLAEKDGGTELQMKHSGFPVAMARDAHNNGWSSTLNRLNDYLDPEGSAGTITLLGDARSSYTRTARMALAEKNVAYTLKSAGPHTPDILAVHPFGRIPGLRDGDICIWETAAILNYLDECFDTGTSLRPGSIMERTRAAQWVSAVNSYLYDTMVRRYVLQVLFPKGEGGKPDGAVVGAALGEMPAQFAALDAAYAKGPYLAGNGFSGADLFLAPILAYVQAFPEGGQLMAGYPNLMRGQALVRERASFKATNPQA
ncbi:MAG: SRPBCC domain-containing protein [Rhodoferax sp.]